jgi:hypothetical protein
VRIKQRLHFLAAPEEGNGRASNGNQGPCARISSSPAFPELYKKNSEPPAVRPGAVRGGVGSRWQEPELGAGNANAPANVGARADWIFGNATVFPYQHEPVFI